MTTTISTPQTDGIRPAPPPRGDPFRAVTHPSIATAATVLAGAAIGVVVADGSPVWQGVRVVCVGLITCLVAWVLTRCDGWAGLVGVLAGATSLAIGVGIGLPHVTKVGPSVLSIAGIVALVAGLVLLAIGTRYLLHAARSWRKVPVVAAVVVSTLLVVLTVGQAVAATNVPRTEVGSENPSDRDLVYQDVTFETADGVTLSGWYIPARNRAAVVLMHGAGSTRSNTLDQAEVLADNGYGVLAFDARGHGRSGGRAMDFGWYGDLDVAAAVSFVIDRGEVDDDQVGAVGLSMGGEEAIGAAAADPRIQAVVAEGATVRMADDKSWLSDEYGFGGQIQEGIETMLFGITDVLTESSPPISLRAAAAAAAPRPMLLITAGAVPDETLAAEHIQSGAPDSVDIWEVEGADHTGGLDTEPDQWEERVVGFLDEHLRDASAQ